MVLNGQVRRGSDFLEGNLETVYEQFSMQREERAGKKQHLLVLYVQSSFLSK